MGVNRISKEEVVKHSDVWFIECPKIYALPAGLDAVLEACQKTRQPMSTTDRHLLADWLRLELARVERSARAVDRHHVAVDRRALEAILWGLDGPEDAPRTPKSLLDWGTDGLYDDTRAIHLHGRCHAARDGECAWRECPQRKTYKAHCPLDKMAVDGR